MKKKNLFKAIIYILGYSVFLPVQSQPVPAKDENIPYLVTFGGDADKSWGDDDFCQIFFFKIPFTQKEPFYLRVYDPGTGGAIVN